MFGTSEQRKKHVAGSKRQTTEPERRQHLVFALTQTRLPTAQRIKMAVSFVANRRREQGDPSELEKTNFRDATLVEIIRIPPDLLSSIST